MSGIPRCAWMSAAHRERVVGVAFGLLRLTLRDRHAGARRQRHDQLPAGRCRRRRRRPSGGPRPDPRPPARPAHEGAPHRRHRGQDTHVLPGRLGTRPAPSQHRRRPGPRQPTPRRRRPREARPARRRPRWPRRRRPGPHPSHPGMPVRCPGTRGWRPPNLIVSCLGLGGQPRRIVRRHRPDHPAYLRPLRGRSGTGASRTGHRSRRRDRVLLRRPRASRAGHPPATPRLPAS